MNDKQRRQLAHFLKTRRARIRTADVGLASGGRRRTPGLRREEVALLAGVGLTWYTWLEQGRDINVSAEVLNAIAKTLRLSEEERSYLLSLGGHLSPSAPLQETVPRRVRQLLQAVEPFPAYVTGRYWDMLAWNDSECALYRDLNEVPSADRNYIWLAFHDPILRQLIDDWEGESDRIVAQFRATAGQAPGEPRFGYLVDKLLATSQEFAQSWTRHDVARPLSRQRRFNHPVVGCLAVEHVMMHIADNPSLMCVVQVPSDDESAEKLRQLHGEAGPRRSNGPLVLSIAADSKD